MDKSLDKKIKNKNHKIIKNTIRFIIALIVLSIQIILYVAIFFGLHFLKDPYPTVYKVIYEIFKWYGVILVLLLFKSSMNQSYKFAWSFFILLCPFIGTVCYIMFGNGRVLSKRKTKKMKEFLDTYNKDFKENIDYNNLDIDFKLISNALSIDSGFNLYASQGIKFYPDALLKHNDMLEEIKKAKKYIFIEYFIIGKGSASKDLFDLLIKKANEGVEVKILTDDIGSIFVRDKAREKELVHVKNLEFKVWEPLGLTINPRVNYRDHRKICVIDGLVAYTGGDNISDEYIHKKERFGYWRDTSIKIYGKPCESFINMFLSMWYMTTNQKLNISKYIPYYSEKNNLNSYVLPFSDGPMNKKNPSYHLFLNMINSAKENIYISSPYFIIDSQMIDALVAKAREGVNVSILIPEIPDKKIVYTMTMSHMGFMLENGVNVYKFKDGFNHAKEVIIDSRYSFVGTVNMDYRSFVLHFEDGVFLYDKNIVYEMNQDFSSILDKSIKLSYKEYKSRNIFIRIFELILQIFSPLF